MLDSKVITILIAVAGVFLGILFFLALILCIRYKWLKHSIKDLMQRLNQPPKSTEDEALATKKSQIKKVSETRSSGLTPSLSLSNIPAFALPPTFVQPPQAVGGAEVESPAESATLGQLKLSMYRDDTSAMYNGTLESKMSEGSSGCIWFTVEHLVKKDELCVTVIQVNYFTSAWQGQGMPRDPFVRLFLFPDERNYRQIRYKGKSFTPRFSETVTFKVDSSTLSSRLLKMSVYDVDKERIRRTLGHCFLPLSEVDLYNRDVHFRTLSESSQVPPQELGELEFSLCLKQLEEIIEVVILRARNLHQIISPNTGIYVKVKMIKAHGDATVRSRKTAPVKGTTVEPVWNELFQFSFKGSCLRDVSFYIKVLTTRKINNTNRYGRIVIGSMFARGPSLLHWQEIQSKPGVRVIKWHRLCS